MNPVNPCRISQRFANPGSYASRKDSHGPAGHHTGTDFGSAWPIPINKRIVRAAMPGEVVLSEYNPTMGNWVGVYNHDHDVLLTYWHMSQRLVHVGEWVLAWKVLGRVGTTGNSTAPHLHLQANHGREFDYHGHIDPTPFLHLSGTFKEARASYRAQGGKHPQSR